MDPAQLLAFNQDAAKGRTELFGVPALFRGVQIRVIESSGAQTMANESGGQRIDDSWRIRIPAEVQPAPRVKESIVQIGTGRAFVITGVVPADPNSTSVQYHQVMAENV